MKFFIATLVHEDIALWKQHIDAHVEYPEKLVAEARIAASGPVKDSEAVRGGARSGLIVMRASSLSEAQSIIDNDPFAQAGVNTHVTIYEWDPVFGLFANESSGSV